MRKTRPDDVGRPPPPILFPPAVIAPAAEEICVGPALSGVEINRLNLHAKAVVVGEPTDRAEEADHKRTMTTESSNICISSETGFQCAPSLFALLFGGVSYPSQYGGAMNLKTARPLSNARLMKENSLNVLGLRTEAEGAFVVAAISHLMGFIAGAPPRIRRTRVTNRKSEFRLPFRVNLNAMARFYGFQISRKKFTGYPIKNLSDDCPNVKVVVVFETGACNICGPYTDAEKEIAYAKVLKMCEDFKIAKKVSGGDRKPNTAAVAEKLPSEGESKGIGVAAKFREMSKNSLLRKRVRKKFGRETGGVRKRICFEEQWELLSIGTALYTQRSLK